MGFTTAFREFAFAKAIQKEAYLILFTYTSKTKEVHIATAAAQERYGNTTT